MTWWRRARLCLDQAAAPHNSFGDVTEGPLEGHYHRSASKVCIKTQQSSCDAMLPQQLTPRGDWRVTAEAAPGSGPGPGQSKLTITGSNRGYLRQSRTLDNWHETEAAQRPHKHTQILHTACCNTRTSTHQVLEK